MAKKKMTMKAFEKSAEDKKMDKGLRKKGIKEGSAKDTALDKKMLAKHNRGCK